MPTIQDIRAKYPQYNDMSDEALASSLHKKFYSDMPPEEFAAKIGMGQTVNSVAKSGQDSYSGQAIAKDMWQQGKQGVKNAVTGMAGLPAFAADQIGHAVTGVAGLSGVPSERAFGMGDVAANSTKFALNPIGYLTGTADTQDMNNLAAQYMGPDQNAQTWQGQLTGDVAEMAAGAIGPGGLVRKGAQIVAPGVASFVAGQATEGTAMRPWAKAGAALVGGVGAGLGAKEQAVNSILKESPFKSQKQLNRAVDTAYDELRSAGAAYTPDDFGRMAGSLGDKLARAGLMEADAPKTWKRVNMILEGAQAGRAPSWDEINSMRTGLGTLMRSAEGPERAAAAKVFDELAKFEKTAGMTSAAGLSQEEMVRKAAQARELALRNIKAKEFGKREANAETYTTGIESGLRNQTANMLRTKYGTRLFKNEAERETLKDVTAGGPVRKMLATAGKAGFDWSKMGNVNALGPAIAAGLPLAASGGYGYSTGDWKTAAAILAAGSAAKIGARKLTERDARRAMALILAGPEAQQGVAQAVKGNRRDALVRLLLAGEGASLSTRE